MILNGARSGFFKSRSVVDFTRSKSAPPPSRVQFMPTTHNITAYLARIHVLNISPFHTARWSRKIARKLPECLLCERKHVPGLIPGLIPGWGPSNIHSNKKECEGYDDDGNGHERKVIVLKEFVCSF